MKVRDASGDEYASRVASAKCLLSVAEELPIIQKVHKKSILF